MQKLKQKELKFKSIFSTINQRSIQSMIKNELLFNFGFENSIKIADAIAHSMVKIFNDYSPAVDSLKPFQILYPTIDKNESPGYAKTISNTKQKMCIITLLSQDELNLLAEGKSYSDILPDRIARMSFEAIEQGGVFIQTDLAILTGASIPSIHKNIELWQKNNSGKLIPLRGVVHDMGMTLTHKKIIVSYHLKGYLTSEIAKLTNHNPVNVERYVSDFERVHLCVKENFDKNRIQFYTGMSCHLVNEYLEIINEQNIDIKFDHDRISQDLNVNKSH